MSALRRTLSNASLLAGLAVGLIMVNGPVLAARGDARLCEGAARSSPDEAIRVCQQLIGSGRRSPREIAKLELTIALAFQSKRLFGDAMAMFERSLQHDTKNPDTYFKRGVLFWNLGEYDRAIQDFDQVIELARDSKLGWLGRGTALVSKGEFESAIRDLDEAIRLDPRFGLAYKERGAAYYRSGDLDRATADFNRFVDLDPKNPDSYNDRAEAFVARGDLDKAIADYDTAIALKPSYSRGYSSRGEAFRIKGDYDRAIADHNEAVRLDPKQPDVYNNRGLTWMSKGDVDHAIADFGEAIKLNPGYDRSYSNRGDALRLKGDLRRSLADLDKAIAIVPKAPLHFCRRGDTLRHSGDLDRALADYTEALRLSPISICAFTGKGMVAEAKGELASAKVEFQRAITTDAWREQDPTTARQTQILAKTRLAAVVAAEAELAKNPIDGGQSRLAAQEAEKLAALRAAVAEQANKLAAAEEAQKLAAIKAQEAERNNKLAAQEAERLASLKAAVAEQTARLSAAQEAERLATAKANEAKVAAQPLPIDPGRRVALVIGNSAYFNTEVLPNPRRDAESIADAFRRIGFKEVTLAKDLTREKLTNTLQDFSKAAASADWAVVYYAGHGIEVDGKNYMIPIDAKLAADTDVGFEAVTLDQVMASVNQAKKLRLVMLDACRDNPFAKTMTRSVGGVTRGNANLGLAAIEPEGATLVVYAARAGQLALDGSGRGNSPFVSAFLRVLEKPRVEIRKMFDLVRDDVMEATSNRQQPFTYGSVPGREDYFMVTR
jgi:tetratricopeptide (TPR) repeat protein